MPTLSHNLDEELPVCITVKGESLSLAPDPLMVSVKDKQRAHWFLSGEGTIDAIDFEGGHPFHADHHHTKSKRHVLSHSVTDTKHVGKKFKYTVHVMLPNGKKISLDPEVHVMP